MLTKRTPRAAAVLFLCVVWLTARGPAPALAFDDPGIQPPPPTARPACDPQTPDGCVVDDAIVVSTPTPPVISVWYGDTQTFGQWGRPQTWINLLGNVSDPGDTVTAVYSLNGSPAQQLALGPDTRRLAALGDFNIEITATSLLVGANQVVITATDSLANQTVKTVNFTYFAPSVWPLPYGINWSSAVSINSVAQVVDGLWNINAGRLRPAQLAYDRLVALGDVTWTDYEVTAPITIHSLDPGGYASPSFGPGVGLILRWTGHTDSPAVCAPGYPLHCGWLPLGALGWYRWSPPDGATQRLVMIGGNSGGTIAQDNSGRTLSLNTDYLFKMRVETLRDQGSYYSLKVWEAAQPEPSAWDLAAMQDLLQPLQGSAVLVAHHVDAAFGNIAVAPGPFYGPTMGADDFNGCALNTGSWTVIDPQAGGPGESDITIQNAYTSNARLRIAVPAGTPHDFAVSGNPPPRVMQTVADTDFDVEVKLDSTMNANDQMQGVLAQQDGQNFIHFDVRRTGGNLRLTAVKYVAGAATPIHSVSITGSSGYMRVKRSGATWLHSYSSDGQTWTAAPSFNHALSVTQVGVFAGNAGGNPAHTALFDYVINTAAPLPDEDEARNTLTVNVAGQGSVARDPLSDNYACDAPVTLTATPATGWSFAGWNGDVQSSANPLQLSMTGPQTITATFKTLIYLPLITK